MQEKKTKKRVKTMWNKYKVVFKLKSPLHIGYKPFKSSVVSPTRYYILGRNFWGAITKRITESFFRSTKSEDYIKIGRDVRKNFIFSYFYLYHGNTVYYPNYKENKLKYGDMDVSDFESRFIGSRISTAIDNSGTAKDESLHEIEYINNKFKDNNGNVNDVKIAGCIWIKENDTIKDKKLEITNDGIYINNFNIIKELILGGESKYGFGHVEFYSFDDKVNFPEIITDIKENANELSGKIQENKPILSHLEYSKEIPFKGEIELLSGRAYYDIQKESNNNEAKDSKPGSSFLETKYYFSPGTIILKNNMDVSLQWDGKLKLIHNK